MTKDSVQKELSWKELSASSRLHKSPFALSEARLIRFPVFQQRAQAVPRKFRLRIGRIFHFLYVIKQFGRCVYFLQEFVADLKSYLSGLTFSGSLCIHAEGPVCPQGMIG